MITIRGRFKITQKSSTGEIKFKSDYADNDVTHNLVSHYFGGLIHRVRMDGEKVDANYEYRKNIDNPQEYSQVHAMEHCYLAERFKYGGHLLTPTGVLTSRSGTADDAGFGVIYDTDRDNGFDVMWKRRHYKIVNNERAFIMRHIGLACDFDDTDGTYTVMTKANIVGDDGTATVLNLAVGDVLEVDYELAIRLPLTITENTIYANEKTYNVIIKPYFHETDRTADCFDIGGLGNFNANTAEDNTCFVLYEPDGGDAVSNDGADVMTAYALAKQPKKDWDLADLGEVTQCEHNGTDFSKVGSETSSHLVIRYSEPVASPRNFSYRDETGAFIDGTFFATTDCQMKLYFGYDFFKDKNRVRAVTVPLAWRFKATGFMGALFFFASRDDKKGLVQPNRSGYEKDGLYVNYKVKMVNHKSTVAEIEYGE